jgi:hypothetical protein
MMKPFIPALNQRDEGVGLHPDALNAVTPRPGSTERKTMQDDYEDVNYAEGLSAFQSARMKAFWDEMIGLVRGQSAELLSFDDIRTRLRLREEYYQGLQDVPLDKIIGSVGRYREFTSRFLPKKAVAPERWSRVYAQATGMMGLPPVELYKVGDAYFVRDGNHRVSVARQLGAKTIQAHVTELPTPISLTPNMSEDELVAAEAYAGFLAESRLADTRPHHVPIQLSELTRYNDLLGHINLHRALLEQQQQRSVPIEEAAADWYDNVYRPAITLIRKYGVLDYMPKRTEGDLYLWLIEHLREVKAQYGDDARARTFSDALVDFLAERRIPVPKDLLTETDRTVELPRVQADILLQQHPQPEKIEQNGKGHHQ